jgi:hypothetical protein
VGGWVGGWKNGWMDGWMGGWVGGLVGGWMDRYLLTAIGLTAGGSSTVHIYTQTIHRTTQLICEECGPCPVFTSYTLACLITEEKTRKNLSQGSRKVPVGTMKTEYTEQNINNNTNT